MTPNEARAELLGSFGLSAIERAIEKIDGEIDSKKGFYKLNPEHRELDLNALYALTELRDKLNNDTYALGSRMANRVTKEEEENNEN